MSRVTLSQLRTFWAAAHSPSLTRAAKQLGVSQPSLSQQLAKLEQAVGTRLFDRSGSELRLTDAGGFLLRRAETVLAQVDEAEAGLGEFACGRRARIAVGALNSLARTLVPDAWHRALAALPGIELDLHELSPREALDQLYGRTIQLALVSANRWPATAVPSACLRWCRTRMSWWYPRPSTWRGSPTRQPAAPRHAAGAGRVIQFDFGTLHTQRVEAWWRRVLPRHEVVAMCRPRHGPGPGRGRPRRGAVAIPDGPAGTAAARSRAALRCRHRTAADRLAMVAVTAPLALRFVPARLEAAGQALELLTPLPTRLSSAGRSRRASARYVTDGSCSARTSTCLRWAGP